MIVPSKFHDFSFYIFADSIDPVAVNLETMTWAVFIDLYMTTGEDRRL